ncbi:hypothetical protein B0I35DRAFT_474161 [Stachybotrys elegans]|uniref:Rhodopsin domain-containing protein n=1 Tax=Stachybotrys elegans TaxID=80388 RepID=A0A8K0WYJ4_9HYPO|nr:hypothetical protein B0I35DRAFT_474161 [Stachybotrys elegans]
MGACTVKEALTAKNLTTTACGDPIRDSSAAYATTSNVLAGIICFAVLQRIVSKLYWRLGISADDWTILVTTIFFTVPSLVINIHGMVANGLGRDVWTVPFDEITRFGGFFQAMAVLYFAQIMMIKLTLLFFLLRIFPKHMTRNVILGTMLFNIVFGLTFVITAIFQCLPVGYFARRWERDASEGSCIDINAFVWSHAAISIALDIWMLAIPLSRLHTLNLDWKKKIGVALMFFVATGFTIVSIIRLRTLVAFGSSYNVTWDYVAVARWSTIEIAIGVICACMPSFRLLIKKMVPVLTSIASTSGSREPKQQVTGTDRVRTHSEGPIMRKAADDQLQHTELEMNDVRAWNAENGR